MENSNNTNDENKDNTEITKMRHDLIKTEHHHTRKQHRKRRALNEMKKILRNTVSIDTSKAGGDLDVVRMCVKEFQWIEYPHGKHDHNCDITWSNKCYERQDSVATVFNKFPGMSSILGKVNLSWCLSLMQKLFPEEYNFYPKTWLLPQQYHAFAVKVTELNHKCSKSRQTFIVKPDDGSQGEGIYLLRDPAAYVISNRLHVVQEYVQKPLLLDGYKFDFRIYATIRSLDPLEVYICREGLVRFCTVPYETPSLKNLTNTFMHLTNYSLNKKSSMFLLSDEDDKGSKQTLTSVLRRLKQLGYKSDVVWRSIQNVVLKTIIAIEPQMLVTLHAGAPFNKSSIKCFQVLGFDILLRDDLSPVLLEVNSNPSLRVVHERETLPGVMEHVTSQTDKVIKAPMLRDTLLIVAPKAKMAAYYNRKMNNRRGYNNKENETQQSESLHEKLETHLPKISTQEQTYVNTNIDNQINCTESTAYKDTLIQSIHIDSPLSDDSRLETPFLLRNTTLQRLVPSVNFTRYESLRIFRRITNLFIEFLGVRSNLRLGPTGFRAFTRKCALTRRGLSTADVDILYIDVQHRCGRDNMEPSDSAGMGYKAFVDAFFEIAKRKFYSEDMHAMIENLVDFCEANMNFPPTTGVKPRLLKQLNVPVFNPAETLNRLRLLSERRFRIGARSMTSLSFT